MRVPSRCPLARVFQDSGRSSIKMVNSSRSSRRIGYPINPIAGDSGIVIGLGYGLEAVLPRGYHESIAPEARQDNEGRGEGPE